MGHLLGYINDLKKHLTTNDHERRKTNILAVAPRSFWGPAIGEIQHDFGALEDGFLPAEILRDQEPNIAVFTQTLLGFFH